MPFQRRVRRPPCPRSKPRTASISITKRPAPAAPVVFVHEFAGDYRTWEPQMRYFSRSHRCVTYSQRGYPPSDVPERSGALRPGYRARRRHRADGRARHRQGARRRPFDGRLYRAACRHPPSAALHFGDRGRLRLGLAARSGGARGDARSWRPRTPKCSPRRAWPKAAAIYGDGADAPAAEIQGPARLCGIRAHARRAFARKATR